MDLSRLQTEQRTLSHATLEVSRGVKEGKTLGQCAIYDDICYFAAYG